VGERSGGVEEGSGGAEMGRRKWGYDDYQSSLMASKTRLRGEILGSNSGTRRLLIPTTKETY